LASIDLAPIKLIGNHIEALFRFKKPDACSNRTTPKKWG
jgi:hypothetical protein